MSYQNIRTPSSSFAASYFRDLIAYRHLALNLAASDLRSRFRRSYLGILWTVIQPLGFSLILGWVWGGLLNYPSIWDFTLYVFGGLIVWEYFTTVFSVSQESLVSAEGYLKQTRIPFFVFQLRTVLTGLVVALAGTIGLLAMLAMLNKFPAPGPHLMLVPLAFVIMVVFFTPLAIIMSILGTQLRDLRHASILAIQALFFVSPIMLPRGAMDPEKLALLNKINPVAELINMFRAPLVDGQFWTSEQMLTVSAWGGSLWLLALFLSVRAGRRLVFAL